MTTVPLALRDFGQKWASLWKVMKDVEAGLRTHAELTSLDVRLRAVLPAEYQQCYEDVQPVSMGSAGLKFDAAGRVAWDQIWDHFCDLAMAGGPPHKGKLLEPATKEAIDAQPDRYREVVREICRALRMVSDLAVEPSPNPGWVRVTCPSPIMAGWLARAIVMENVSAYLEGSAVDLPAGPHYRLEKEVKNVVTSLAKTFHYFDGHLEPDQQTRIASVFNEPQSPLLQPARTTEFATNPEVVRIASESAAARIAQQTGLPKGGAEYFGWLGVECPDVRTAIWIMRALVVNNTFARREERCLYVPVHPVLDPDGARIASVLARVHRLASARNLTSPA